MNDKLSHIDELAFNALKNYEPEVATRVWDNISQKLDHKKRIRALYQRMWMAASILVILSFSVGFLFSDYLNKKTEIVLAKAVYSRYSNLFSYNNNAPAWSSHQEISIGNEAFNTEKKSDEYNSQKGNILQEQIVKDTTFESKSFNGYVITNQYDTMDANEVNTELSLVSELSSKSYMKPTQEPSLVLLEVENKKALLNPQIYIEVETVKSKKESRWEILADFGTVYSYRDLQRNYYDESSANFNKAGVSESSYYNSVEKGMYSYSAGIKAGYNLSKRFSLSSGIEYVTLGQESQIVFAENISMSKIPEYQISTSTGKIETSFHDIESYARSNERLTAAGNIYDKDASVVELYEFIEIPMTLAYKVIDKKFRISIKSGLGADILMLNTNYMKGQLGQVDFESHENLNKVNYTGHAGLTIGRQLGKHLLFSLEPRVKYFLKPLNEDNSFNTHPYILGCFSSLIYKF